MNVTTKDIIKYGVISLCGVTLTSVVFFKRYSIINYFKKMLISNSDSELKLTLKRYKKGENFTLGKLYINGVFFCYTLEDKDRGLKQSMSESEISKIKVKSETAIPTGSYDIEMNVVSPRFSKRGSSSQYASINNKLPRLLNVKGFDGVLIHIGNYISDTDACILVGNWANEIKGTISDSTNAFFSLYEILKEANDKGKSITLKIK